MDKIVRAIIDSSSGSEDEKEQNSSVKVSTGESLLKAQEWKPQAEWKPSTCIMSKIFTKNAPKATETNKVLSKEDKLLALK